MLVANRYSSLSKELVDWYFVFLLQHTYEQSFWKKLMFNVVQWILSIPQKNKIDVHQFGLIDMREFRPQFEKFELEIYLQMMTEWINTAVDAITPNTIALGWIVVSANPKT